MSERGSRKGDRFRWWNSDRSGLQFGFVPLTSPPNAYTRESGRPVRDNGIQVAPDEFDTPPPSTKPLGGEGEIGTGARADSTDVYDIPPGSLYTVQYLTSLSTITWNSDNIPMQIVGSNQAITMASNPQVSPGPDKKMIVLMGVGSAVTLNNGSGLRLHTSLYRMGSGYLLNLIYSQSDSLWYETSRGVLYGDLGAL